MEIIAIPIEPQLVQTPAVTPIIDPITPVPVFLEFDLIVLIWKTARLLTTAINTEVAMIRIKLAIQSRGRWKVKYGSKNKNSLAYNMNTVIVENREKEIIHEEMLQ